MLIPTWAAWPPGQSHRLTRREEIILARRAIGISSYYNGSRSRTYIDVTSQEIKQQQELDKINRQVDMIGQSVLVLAIFLLVIVIGFNIGRWIWSLI